MASYHSNLCLGLELSDSAVELLNIHVFLQGETRMREALQVAWALVQKRTWTKDKYERYTSSCFRAALQARAGDEMWAKLFLVCGKVDRRMVYWCNMHTQEWQIENGRPALHMSVRSRKQGRRPTYNN